MSDDLRTAIEGYVREALDLRFAGELPKPGLDGALLTGLLLDVRQRLDRVEELLARALRIRGHARRQADHVSAVAEDALDGAIVRARTAPAIRGDEYSSAKERLAHANLQVLDERRAARAAAELAHHCDEAVDLLRLTQRGLESTRHDHLALLRALQFESTMDR